MQCNAMRRGPLAATCSGAIAGLFAAFVVFKLRNRHHVGWVAPGFGMHPHLHTGSRF